MHVKENLSQILRYQIREKNPIKSEKDISKEIEKIQNSYIEESIWKKILHKIYQHEDANYLCSKLYEKIRSRNNKENRHLSQFLLRKMPARSKSKSRLTKHEEGPQNVLLYQSEFIKVILDFQLEEHERFLQEFNLLFKEVDGDHNGIINEEEFKQLILAMNVVVQNVNEANRDVETLLKVIDPHGNQQMTYTEVVSLLSNQMVPKYEIMR